MIKKLLPIISKYHLVDHLIGLAVCAIAGGCWVAYIVTFASVSGARQ